MKNMDMEVTKNEWLLIYNSDILQDREALGYAKSIGEIRLQEMDIAQERPTERQIKQLAEKMNVQVSDLLLEKNEDSEEDQLKLLENNPDKWKTPIVVKPEAAYFLGASLDLIKKGLKIK